MIKLIQKIKNKRESGNIVDAMGSLFVVILLFAMILVMAAYGSLVEKKLAIDNTVKEYLYLEEQYGYLRGAPSELPKSYTCSNGVINTSGLAAGSDAENLVRDLCTNNGVTKVIIESGTTRVQQAYGNEVVLKVTVTFNNPIFKEVGTNSKNGPGLFKVFGLKQEITYTIEYKATSRW